MKVLVIGDGILDISRTGTSTRVSPEDKRCLVLKEESKSFYLGGAANVAAWLSRGTNHEVTLICHYGIDEESIKFKHLCRYSDILLSPLLQRNATIPAMTVKERVILKNPEKSSIKQLVRVDRETQAFLNKKEYEDVCSEIHSGGYDAFVVADYCKGVFEEQYGSMLIKTLKGNQGHLALRSSSFNPLIINSKIPARWEFNRCDFLIFNNKESKSSWGRKSYADVKKRTYANYHLVTLGAKGVYISPGNTTYPSLARNVLDVTGAGDAMTSGVVAKLLQFNKSSTCLTKEERSEIIFSGQTWAAQCCAQIGCGHPKSRIETSLSLSKENPTEYK